LCGFPHPGARIGADRQKNGSFQTHRASGDRICLIRTPAPFTQSEAPPAQSPSEILVRIEATPHKAERKADAVQAALCGPQPLKGPWASAVRSMARSALRRRGAACAAPILVAAALLGCWSVPRTDAFSASPLSGGSAFAPAPATNALGGVKLVTPVDSRRAALRAQNGASGVSMKAVRNPQLIGTMIPRQWTEGTEFIRDGRGIATGDVVIIRRSDGRCVWRTS